MTPTIRELQSLVEEAVKSSAHIVEHVDLVISCNLIANGIVAGLNLDSGYRPVLKSLIQREINKIQTPSSHDVTPNLDHFNSVFSKTAVKEKKCSCGSHSIKSSFHSSWCDLK